MQCVAQRDAAVFRAGLRSLEHDAAGARLRCIADAFLSVSNNEVSWRVPSFVFHGTVFQLMVYSVALFSRLFAPHLCSYFVFIAARTNQKKKYMP